MYVCMYVHTYLTTCIWPQGAIKIVNFNRWGSRFLFLLLLIIRFILSLTHLTNICLWSLYCILPWIMHYVYNIHPCFWSILSGKKSFVLTFNSIFNSLIYRYLFLYYKGILAFIFEHIMVQKYCRTNNYITREQIQGISRTTHV